MLAVIFVTPAYATYHWTLDRVGVDPLMAASRTDPIRDQRMLLAKMQVHRADIVDRIHRAQPNWNAMEAYNAMMMAASRGQITFTELPPGTHIPWMAFGIGSGGVQFDTIWDGPNPLPGFGIFFSYQGREVRVFVPIWCGNLSLITTVSIPPQVMTPPPMQAPPPAYEAPPPPPLAVYPPQQQYQYQQPYTPVSFGVFSGAPCGGMTNYKIQANSTYISNYHEQIYAPTDASYRAWGNGNTTNSGNSSTYAPYNQQSWKTSNQQSWTNTSTTTTQRRGYNPSTQPTTPYCPPGQPAGRNGSGYNYAQPVLTGSALPSNNGGGNPVLGSTLPGNNGGGNPNLGSALPGTGTRAALTGSSLGSALPGNNGSGNPALGSALPGSGTRATLPGSSLGSALPGNNGSGNPVLGSALPGRR
jgi:hypothetical protein